MFTLRFRKTVNSSGKVLAFSGYCQGSRLAVFRAFGIGDFGKKLGFFCRKGL